MWGSSDARSASPVVGWVYGDTRAMRRRT